MTMRADRSREIAVELDRIGAAEAGDVPPAHWAFREAAAVLAWFDPPSLRPTGKEFARQSALTWILADSEPVIGEDGERHWALQESIRRRTLRRLKKRSAMQRALAANAKRPDSATQQAFEAIVDGRPPDPELPEGAVLEAVEWVKGTLDDLPSTSDLRRRVGLTRLLRPLRALVGTKFQGREDVLGQLRDYVGVLPADEGASGAIAVMRQGVRFIRRLRWSLSEEPPLFIWGPGGVGKSTVIAKFVLDHVVVGEECRIPFAFLNFDRAGLVADEPLTLLREAVRQVAVQYPQVASRADALTVSLTEAIAARGTSLSEAAGLDHTVFLDELHTLVAQAEPSERPFLLVLDTFEEVQYLGHDRVEIVWSFLEDLQASMPQLCTVVAGRAKPEAVAANAVYLGPFDDVAAAALVDGLLREAGRPPLESEEMQSLLDAIGTVPLSLKLAVGLLVKEEGEEGRTLSGIETRRKVFGFRLLRAKAASIQGQLYGRLLDHIHDPEVRKLAYPGLVLRRLTPPIIREVLAEPCGVEVHDDEQAEQLYAKLAREATLVEEVDGALEHRIDVRRLMLGDLSRQFPEQAQEIHQRAVSYYAARSESSDLRERAEEIYHRLWLDEPFEAIEKRWIPGVETYLKGALEEVEPAAQRYLARRLGVTPDESLSAQADLQEWEQMAAASARRLLAARDPEAALRELRLRAERSDAGPIYALEAEALRLLGRWKEATKVALRGLEAAGRAGDLAHAADLEMILTLVHEAQGDAVAALAAARRTRERATDARQQAVELRAMVAELRLLRKIDEVASTLRAGKGGRQPAKEIESLRGEILARADRLSRRDLLRHPTLLRELAAEVAAERPDLLGQSLRLAGFQTAGDKVDERHEVTSLLIDIDSAHDGDHVAIAAGIDPKADRPQAWRTWVDQRGPRLGRSVADLLERVEISKQGVDAVRGVLRTAVDLSIRKPFV